MYAGKPSVADGETPLYFASLKSPCDHAAPRVSPNATVSKTVGLNVCVWLMATRWAEPVPGP